MNWLKKEGMKQKLQSSSMKRLHYWAWCLFFHWSMESLMTLMMATTPSSCSNTEKIESSGAGAGVEDWPSD
jgi:hypothetical protein